MREETRCRASGCGRRCLVMLNAFPYNSGHLVVSPHRHVAAIERTSTTTSCSSFMAVTADTRVLPQALEDSYAQLRARFT